MTKENNKRVLLFFLDILFVFISFSLVLFFSNRKELLYLTMYLYPLGGFLAIWITTSLLNEKYKSKTYFNEVLIANIKNLIFASLITISAIYIFNRFSYSRVIVFGTIILTTIFNIVAEGISLLNKKSKKYIEEVEALDTEEFAEKDPEPVESIAEIDDPFAAIDIPIEKSICYNLKSKYLATNPFLFEFLEKHIPLNKITHSDTLLLSSANIFNIQNIEPDSQLFFLNLRRINDIRRFNMYFIQVNENLKHGGYFVGTCITNEIRRKNIQRKYPPGLSTVINLMDFFFHRVFPKMPYVKGIYFFLTKGSNRPVSKSEVLGRLKFCGFEIIDTTIIDKKFYFIVKKTAAPRSDINPSYGPFIKLNRVGKDHKIIQVFKFRTMHPYSEFLQDYVYKHHQLDEGGKLKNDFRVTEWGRMFRKMWIDEFPQFINLLRGEIKLVGVRAISEHYFSLYPEDVQNLRTKTKPGLVPPFYVDLPKTFDEIVESERKYLHRYLKRPLLTDIQYFFLAFRNIIFKNARSQ